MEQLISVDKFEALLNTYNKKGVVSNFYMLKEEYAKYIQSQDLYYVEDEENLYIYQSRNGFVKLFYFINNLSRIYNTKNINQTQVLEVIYRGEKQYPQSEVNFWESSGFNPHLSRDCFFLKNKELSIDSTTHPQIRITFATTENELLYSKKLIEENLDKYTGDQLSKEELQNFANAKMLYIAYENNLPCGMLQADFKKGIFWLGHVVVDSDFRGKGISKVLLEYYLRTGKNLNCNQFQLWVLQDNKPAVNLYRKYGFEYLNRSTCSMIKK